MDKSLIAVAEILEQKLAKYDSELECIKSLLINNKTDNVLSEYLPSESVRKTLNVSRKTWFNIRRSGKIPFIQISRHVYIKASDFRAYMEAHYINPNNL
jgi:hypothetical protein